MRNVLALASTRRSVALFPFVALGALACGGSRSSGSAATGEASARAVVELATVPADVFCVEIDVAGARAVTDRFDVVPNQTAVLSLTGLPLGDVSFTGLAYPAACGAVTSATQATWISPATPATLVPETVANVSLALVPNGQASVSVGFNPDDAGTDAADAAPVDAAPPFSFASPAMIPLPFNADTVATLGHTSVTTIDAVSHALVTVSLANQLVVTLFGPPPFALPDDATFAAVGTSMPAVQLGWAGASGAASSLLMASTTGQTTTFLTPHGQFAHLQLYALSTEGPATLDYTFFYGSATKTASISVPDWCEPGDAGATVPVRASVNRLVVGDAGETVDTMFRCNIYALDLNPDPTQTLTGLTLAPVGGGSSAARFVVYGAAAW
jgi:hypothetical protein